MPGGRLTRRELLHERVEPIPARVGSRLGLLVPPGEHDIRAVLLVGHVRLGRLVEVPVNPVRGLLQRLRRVLVGEERLDGLGALGLDDVDREDPVLALLRRRRVQAEPELLPGWVLPRGLLELCSLSRLEELLDDLARRDGRGFLLGGLGVDRVVALGARAAANSGEREEKAGG